MNIIQQQEALKDLSDSQIASEMQRPSGQMPLYLVSTEAKRRADLRNRYKADASGPPPASTVQEDLLRSVMSSQMTPTGIAQGISPTPPPASKSALQMSPTANPSAAGIMQGATPQGLPGNAQMQPQGFANGGQVRRFNVGGILADVMNDPGVSQFEKRKLYALSQRNAATRAGIAGLSTAPDYTGADFGGISPPNSSSVPVRRLPSIPSMEDGAPLIPNIPPMLLGGEDGLTAQNEAANATRRSINASEPADMFGQDGMNYEPSSGGPDYDGPPYVAPTDPDYTLADFGGVPRSFDGNGTSPMTPLQQAEAEQEALISGLGAGGAGGAGNAADMPSLKLDSSFDYKQTLANKLAELNKQGDPYADQAAKLTAREDDIKSDADANKWMALARAGFGAAAGTSQYGLENIAQGAMAGLDDYNASQKDITAREDKLFDANTAMIGLQENLKAVRADESYRFAQGMQSAAETNNNIKIAENRARVEQQKIKATEEQSIRTLRAGALDSKLTRAARAEQNKETRESNERIAKLPPKELQLVNELVRLSSSKEPGDMKAAEILETTLNPSLSKALTVQDKKWGQAMSAAGKVMEMPIPTDEGYKKNMAEYSNLVLQNFTALGGNEQLGQSFIIARLGGGTSSRVPPTGSIVNGVFVKN